MNKSQTLTLLELGDLCVQDGTGLAFNRSKRHVTSSKIEFELQGSKVAETKTVSLLT